MGVAEIFVLLLGVLIVFSLGYFIWRTGQLVRRQRRERQELISSEEQRVDELLRELEEMMDNWSGMSEEAEEKE